MASTVEDGLTLKAEFELDDKGVPISFVRGGVRHYEIRLSVPNAPSNAYAVTYELHDSYYDPIRESLDTAHGFGCEITSFGDFAVRVSVRSPAGRRVLRVDLSRALAASYPTPTASIARAIQDISAN